MRSNETSRKKSFVRLSSVNWLSINIIYMSICLLLLNLKLEVGGTKHKCTSINIFLFKLEMKQRYLVGKMSNQDDKEDGGLEEVNMDTLGEAVV